MPPIAFLNGDFVPAHEATVPVTDWGFLQGITLAEQLRTFRGAAFLATSHFDRLFNGLRRVNWQLNFDADALARALEQLVDHNWTLLDPEDDLGVTVFVTPGTYPIYQTDRTSHPSICMHTYPLPFRLWHQQYQTGQHLVTVAVQQVPPECWPSDLKCRSRMHYYLAAQEARTRKPGATALLLDRAGNISETPTSNVVAYFRNAGLVSPAQDRILPGISLSFFQRLAAELGVPWTYQDLSLAQLRQADEIIVTSTPFCMLPVAQIDDQQLEAPGPVYQSILQRWSQKVGLDIAAQASRFFSRRS